MMFMRQRMVTLLVCMKHNIQYQGNRHVWSCPRFKTNPFSINDNQSFNVFCASRNSSHLSKNCARSISTLHKRRVKFEKQDQRKSILIPLINKLLQQAEYLSLDEWENICKDLKEQKIMGFLPALLMGTISTFEDPAAYTIGQSLYEYTSKTVSKPNIAFLTSHMVMCSNHGHNDEALRSYKILSELTDVFDSGTCARLISSFSQMDSHWRKSFDFLEMARFIQSENSQHYSPIILAAMRNHEKSLAFDLIKQLQMIGYIPWDEVFIEALNQDNDFVWRILANIRDYGWIVSENVGDHICQWFSL